MDVFRYQFGYTPWTLGHVVVAAVALPLAVLAWRLGWRRWTVILSSLVAAWAIVGAAIVNGPLRFNRPVALPTPHFLESGVGRVLDGGAGSGRSALMVLLARPQARVVALDIFDNGYGIGDNTPERLLANARTAGVGGRLEARRGDMRDMPFADGEFDAAVSAYAIDHLREDGITRALDEMHRVVRPGGDFLIFVMNADAWIEVAFPGFPEHGFFGKGTREEAWRDRLTQAGFEVLEAGRTPGTVYLLGRRS